MLPNQTCNYIHVCLTAFKQKILEGLQKGCTFLIGSSLGNTQNLSDLFRPSFSTRKSAHSDRESITDTAARCNLPWNSRRKTPNPESVCNSHNRCRDWKKQESCQTQIEIGGNTIAGTFGKAIRWRASIQTHAHRGK